MTHDATRVDTGASSSHEHPGTTEGTDVATMIRLRERRLRNHPLQTAIGGDLGSRWHTENMPTPPGEHWVRYNRCPTCEQWSPCAVRKEIVAELAALTADSPVSRVVTPTEWICKCGVRVEAGEGVCHACKRPYAYRVHPLDISR